MTDQTKPAGDRPLHISDPEFWEGVDRSGIVVDLSDIGSDWTPEELDAIRASAVAAARARRREIISERDEIAATIRDVAAQLLVLGERLTTE